MRPLHTNLHLSYLIFAAFLSGAMAPANAIEKTEQETPYGNVGALGFDVDGPMGATPPFGVCTGFVISDRAFVTAAHCITPFEQFAQSWAVTLDPGSPDSPVIQPGIFTGANIFDFPIQGETFSTTIVHLHPWFDDVTDEYDVAVLEFPAGTFDVAPVRLARYRLLNWLRRLRILNRIPIGVVGYGADEVTKQGLSIPGYRKYGFSAIGDLSHTRLTLEPRTILDANVLAGDSGSPQFILGRAVSLTSSEDLQRLDIPGVRRFLARFTGR